MTKYTNPFHTIEEAQVILKSLGTNPCQSGTNFYGKAPLWPEQVLGIVIDKRYEEGTHYFEYNVQLTKPGFDEVSKLIGCEVKTLEHSDCFDKLLIEPSPRLKLFTLIPKETAGEIL